MFADHPQNTTTLVANVAGFVTNEPLEYNAAHNRYQLFIELVDDVDGLDVVVSDADGDCDTAPLH